MKCLRLHIRNFRLHADTEIVFPPDGVMGIIGSNESGKSTILEAITWALFGAKATRGTLAGIRWHGAPPRKTASVTFSFEIGGKQVWEELSTAATGLSAGQGATFVRRPGEGESARVRSFELRVLEVKEAKLPELDDEFAKHFGE